MSEPINRDITFLKDIAPNLQIFSLTGTPVPDKWKTFKEVFTQAIKEKNPQQCRENISFLLNHPKLSTERVLANLYALFELSFSELDIKSQKEIIISLFYILGRRPIDGEASFFSQLLQVKSLKKKPEVLAIISIVFAIKGYTVNYVGVNPSKNNEDYQFYLPIFKEFGIEENIQYLTAIEARELIINEQISTPTVLVVDEAETFLAAFNGVTNINPKNIIHILGVGVNLNLAPKEKMVAESLNIGRIVFDCEKLPALSI